MNLSPECRYNKIYFFMQYSNLENNLSVITAGIVKFKLNTTLCFFCQYCLHNICLIFLAVFPQHKTETFAL